MPTQSYDPAAAGAALDAAATALRQAGKAARSGGRDDLAAILDAAIGDLRARSTRAEAIVALITWPPERARAALTAAGVDSAALTDRGVEVQLPTARLLTVPAAQLDGRPASGYAVQVLAPDGSVVLRLRADDDDDLTATVKRLVRQAS